MIQLQIFSFLIIVLITVVFKPIKSAVTPEAPQKKPQSPPITTDCNGINISTIEPDSNDMNISTIEPDSDDLVIPAIKSDRFIVMTRHGETEWTKLGIFCGWYNSPLTEKGKLDAVNCANKIEKYINITFDKAYTSQLDRANESLNIILETIGQENVPIKKSWKLNERHYGNLTGQLKTTAENTYGKEKLEEYRRSFNVMPPDITTENPYYKSIIENQKFIDDEAQFPLSETLKTTMLRVVPYWNEYIVPDILAKQKVLMVTHGTVLRSLIKHLEKLSETDINDVNVPTGIPFIYEFDENMNIMGSRQYLADKKELEEAIKRTKNIKNT